MSANELKQPVTTPPLFSSLLLFSTITTFIVTCSSVNYHTHRQQFKLHSLSSVQPLTTGDTGEVTSFREDQFTLYPSSLASASASESASVSPESQDDSYGHSDQQWLYQQQQPDTRHQSTEYESPQSSHGFHGYAAIDNEHRQSHLYDSSSSDTYSDVTGSTIERKSDAPIDRTRRSGRRSISNRPISTRSRGQCIGPTCSLGSTWSTGGSGGSGGAWSSGARPAERRSGGTSSSRPSINKRWLEDSRPSHWSIPKYSGHLQSSFDRSIEQQSSDRYAASEAAGSSSSDIDTDDPFTSEEDDESTRPASTLSSYFTKSSLPQDVEGHDKHTRDAVERFIEKVNSLEAHRKARSHSHGHNSLLSSSPTTLLLPPPPSSPSARHSQHNSLQLSRTLAVPEESAGYFSNSATFSHPGHMIQLPRSTGPSQVQSPMDWSTFSSPSLGPSFMSPHRAAVAAAAAASFEREPRVSRSLSLKGHLGPMDGEMPDLEDESEAGDSSGLTERNYDFESRGKSASGQIDTDRMSSFGSLGTGREVLRRIKQQSQYAQMMTGGDSADGSGGEGGDEQSFADRIGRSGGPEAGNYETMSGGSKRGSWSRQYWRKLSPDNSPVPSGPSPFSKSASHMSSANGFDGYLQGLYGTPPPLTRHRGSLSQSRSSGPVTMDNLPYLDPMPALDKTLMENFLQSNSKLPSALLGSESFSDPGDSERSNGDSHRSTDSSARDSILQGLSRISIPRFTSLFSGRSDSRKRRKHTRKQSDDDEEDEEDSPSCSDSNDSSDSKKSVKIVDPPSPAVVSTETASTVSSLSETTRRENDDSSLSSTLSSTNSTLTVGTSSPANTFQTIPVPESNGTSATNELITSSVNSSVVTVLPVTTPLVM